MRFATLVTALAIKAQKDRIEGEIKKMQGEVEGLEQDKRFARYCKETFVLAKNMAAAEVEREDAVASGQEEQGGKHGWGLKIGGGGGENGGDGGNKGAQKLLQTANALMSVENIDQELKASTVVVDFASIELAKNEKDVESLLKDINRLENCEILGPEQSEEIKKEENEEKEERDERKDNEGKKEEADVDATKSVVEDSKGKASEKAGDKAKQPKRKSIKVSGGESRSTTQRTPVGRNTLLTRRRSVRTRNTRRLTLLPLPP